MQKAYCDFFELKELAQKLQERYYAHLGHISLDGVFFAEIIGEKPEKIAVIELNGTNSSWHRMILVESHKELYCVAVWGEAWAEIPPDTQCWLLFDILLGVGPKMDGKITQPDVKDYGIVLQFLGPYWNKKQDALPSLLAGDNPLDVPLPMSLYDYGEDTHEY